MTVKVVNKSKHNLPQYAHITDAGFDLKADLDEPITLRSLERTIIPTGLHIAVPEGHVLMICPRSGLADKQGLSVLNAPGIVDVGFTNQVGVILVNLSMDPVMIHPGDRVAQGVFVKYEHANWQEVATLDATERGDAGFGSTGK